MGTEQWLPLRDQSTMAVGQTDLLKVHDPRTRHYLDCYWQYFHPPCPIVRRASFVSTIPQPLLAASMVVVGAQFSPRPDAKPYSTSLYERCLKLLLDVSLTEYIPAGCGQVCSFEARAVPSRVSHLFLTFNRSSTWKHSPCIGDAPLSWSIFKARHSSKYYTKV